MAAQVLPARCARCEAPNLTWGHAPTGIAYLRNPDGSEHWQTCLPAFTAQLLAEPIAAPRPIAASAPAIPAPALADADEREADEEFERLAREADEAETMREATRGERARLADWPMLRRAILAYGGIGPSPDWPRDWYPADLYRVHGKSPDIVAAEVKLGRARPPWAGMDEDGRGDGDDGAMFDYLQRSWADWQALQQERRPRTPRAAARPVREALTAPAPTANADLRAATLSMARLVADVADLVAVGAAPAGLARQVADAARTLAEANA